ncbi:MAG: hypothetical protein K2N28_08685 [Muribaculaceae bacterium]|nr:hypothetical protein [Muribaculaceae bacterium]
MRLIVAGVVLASMPVMVSCGSKASRQAKAITEAIENAEEGTGLKVKANALADTVLNIDGRKVQFCDVARIFEVDEEGDFYLSVRAIVPAAESEVTADLYNKVSEYFSAIIEPDTVTAVVADTPAEFAAGLDEMGREFVATVTPMAEDAETAGYMMDVDIRPVYGKSGYTTYAVYADFYTGGAHGTVDTYFETYDNATSVPYSFESMFTPEGQREARVKLVEAIAGDKGMSVDEYLVSVNDFVMPDEPITVENFPVYHVGITGLGVVFTYPKYSIAAGFEGCPAYVLGFDDVSGLLVEALRD